MPAWEISSIRKKRLHESLPISLLQKPWERRLYQVPSSQAKIEVSLRESLLRKFSDSLMPLFEHLKGHVARMAGHAKEGDLTVAITLLSPKLASLTGKCCYEDVPEVTERQRASPIQPRKRTHLLYPISEYPGIAAGAAPTTKAYESQAAERRNQPFENAIRSAAMSGLCRDISTSQRSYDD